MPAGLALIGEPDVAVLRDGKVVATQEGFEQVAVEPGLAFAGLGIAQHHALVVVGDQQASVGEELHPVRLPVVFEADFAGTVRRDLEHPAPGNVGHPQVAVCVEDRPFQKDRGCRAVELDLRPFGGLAEAAELVGNAAEYFGRDGGRGGEHHSLLT